VIGLAMSATAAPNPSFDELSAFARARIAEYIKSTPDAVDIDGDLSALGLDSSDAVVLAAELEDWLNLEIEPELFLRHTELRPALQEIYEVLQQPA
jgi:acyl carrier protein